MKGARILALSALVALTLLIVNEAHIAIKLASTPGGLEIDSQVVWPSHENQPAPETPNIESGSTQPHPQNHE